MPGGPNRPPMVAAPTESGQSTAAHAYVAGRETGCSRSRARVSGMPPGQAKTSPKTIAGRENSIGTKPVEKLGSKPNRITDRTTTPIGNHSESFSVRIMRIELTTVSREATPPGSIRRPQGRPLGTRAGHPKTRAPPAGIVTLSDLTATARTKTAAFQITGFGPTLPEHPSRRLQYLLPSTSFTQQIHVQTISEGRIQCMGKCECGRLKGDPCGPLRPNTINVTMS